MAGYTRTHRKIFTHPFWEGQRFSEREAFLDMVNLAAWKDTTKIVRGNIVPIKRGELAWSVRALAERWGWAVNTVRSYMDRLEKAGMIDTQKSKLSNRYIIVNYEKYQNDDTQNDTQNDTSYKKDKKDKKESIKRFVKPTVEEISEYCKKRQNSINPQRFYDHYEAKGWMIGKNKMKCWKSAVRTWEGNDKNKAEKAGKTTRSISALTKGTSYESRTSVANRPNFISPVEIDVTPSRLLPDK